MGSCWDNYENHGILSVCFSKVDHGTEHTQISTGENLLSGQEFCRVLCLTGQNIIQIWSICFGLCNGKKYVKDGCTLQGMFFMKYLNNLEFFDGIMADKNMHSLRNTF